ncbi:MAG: ferritin family protein [Candidatus Omnitrophica bacterium]|nr:ferritin family protein [Candidatus Omnitrophota bacterium]
MEKTFSACEIIELGIQIEKNGKDFYSELAKKTNKKEVKSVLLFLSSEEAKHIDIFKKLSTRACSYNPSQAYTDEYFAYLRSLADSYVFTKKDKGVEIAAKIKEDKEGVDLGVRFEKDSILFYQEMKKFVPENDKALIETLIEEEKKHLSRLCALKVGMLI